MDNLRSKYVVNSTEPIVFTFDIDQKCNQYTFGLSQFGITKNIEQNLYVLKNIPFWKSPLDKEVSSYKVNDTTFVSNFGDTLFGKKIAIFERKNQENNYYYKQSFNGESETLDYTLLNQSNEEIPLNEITINYDVYVESSKNDGEILYRDGIKFLNSELDASPFVLQGMVFNTAISFTDSDEVYLTIEDEGSGDLIMLSSDYECAIDKNNDINVTTIIPFVEDQIENVYYTNESNYDKVRFVISDNGRYISHATSTQGNDFENNMGFLLSVKPKDEHNKNVSVRFTIDNKDYATNLTSNF